MAFAGLIASAEAWAGDLSAESPSKFRLRRLNTIREKLLDQFEETGSGLLFSNSNQSAGTLISLELNSDGSLTTQRLRVFSGDFQYLVLRDNGAHTYSSGNEGFGMEDRQALDLSLPHQRAFIKRSLSIARRLS